jgi:hypothetical protein
MLWLLWWDQQPKLRYSPCDISMMPQNHHRTRSGRDPDTMKWTVMLWNESLRLWFNTANKSIYFPMTDHRWRSDDSGTHDLCGCGVVSINFRVVMRLAKVILRERWIVESWMTIHFCESLRRIGILNLESEILNVEFVIEKWGMRNEKWGMRNGNLCVDDILWECLNSNCNCNCNWNWNWN